MTYRVTHDPDEVILRMTAADATRLAMHINDHPNFPELHELVHALSGNAQLAHRAGYVADLRKAHPTEHSADFQHPDCPRCEAADYAGHMDGIFAQEEQRMRDYDDGIIHDDDH